MEPEQTVSGTMCESDAVPMAYRGGRVMKPPAALYIALVALIVGACSGDAEPVGVDGDPAATAQPTPAAPAAAVDITSSDATGYVPGLPFEEQKKRLVAIAGRQFSGLTAHDP